MFTTRRVIAATLTAAACTIGLAGCDSAGGSSNSGAVVQEDGKSQEELRNQFASDYVFKDLAYPTPLPDEQGYAEIIDHPDGLKTDLEVWRLLIPDTKCWLVLHQGQVYGDPIEFAGILRPEEGEEIARPLDELPADREELVDAAKDQGC